MKRRFCCCRATASVPKSSVRRCGPARNCGAILPSVRSARSAHRRLRRFAQGLPPLPDETLAAARESDAILLGAVGDPEFDTGDSSRRPETALLQIRRELKLYANLRPAKVWPGLEDSGPLKTNRGVRHRHAGRPRVDRRLVLRRAARHRGRRQFRAQHDAVLATRDRADRAPRVRRRPASPEARHVGGQGERARDVSPVAAGGRAPSRPSIRTSHSITCWSIPARCGSRSRRRASTSS